MKKRTLLIFAIVYIAYTSIYIARLNLSVANPVFVELGIADAAQIGLLGSIFSIIYACGRLINGGLGDRVAPYKLICSGMLVAGLANLMIGALPPFWGIAILWGANAYAQSMLWSSVLCIISALCDKETAKKVASYMVSSVATGNIIGILINTWIVDRFGVNFAFLIPGGITLIMATAVFFSTKQICPVASQTKKSISFFTLLKNRDLLLMTVPAMLHGAIKDNVSLWMTAFFVDIFLIHLSDSAYFVLFIPLLGFIGRTMYPAIYKICRQNEHLVSIVSFLICGVLAIPLCFKLSSPVIAVICLGAIYALVSVINTSILSIYPIRFSDTGNVSSVSGFMDFATYGGAGICSWIYGIVIKHIGYVPMYISWSVFCLGGLLIMIKFLRSDRSKSKL